MKSRIKGVFSHMKNKIVDWLNFQFQGVGFRDTSDFMTSTFHVDKNWSLMFALSSFVGMLGLLIEKYLGLEPIVYIAFTVLLVAEFLTGIRASLKQGQKIQSRKFNRMIIKIGAYSFILWVIHSMKSGADPAPALWHWVHFTVFNMLAIQLLLSVLENLVKLGLAESVTIIRVLQKTLKKWFDLEDPQNHD